MKLKPVFTWSSRERKLRLFRVLWERGKVGQAGGGYSAKCAVALVPKLWGLYCQIDEWRVTLLGLQMHYLRSYSGRFV